jgi:hypothetical protein
VFRFRKIYADLVTDDGTVLIAYLAWTEAGGLSGAGSGLELYRPDGSREVVRARSSFPPEPPVAEGGPVEVRLELPDASVRLRYEPSVPPWVPAPAPVAGLSWAVRVPWAKVEATWEGRHRRLVGTGYVDWVELTRPTRRLGLSRLDWARVHTAQAALVYTGVHVRDGASWHRGALWRRSGDGAPRVRTDVRLRAPGLHPGRLECDDDPDFNLVLKPQRVLHQGPVIDRARSPGLLERSLFRLITGRSHETRWVSRAYRADADESVGWAIHEVVRFGN